MTELIETLRRILKKFAEGVQKVKEHFRIMSQRMKLERKIRDCESRLEHVERILPVTKHSVRRKKLLQKRKRLKDTMGELLVQKMKAVIEPIREEEIDIATLNLKNWHERENVEFDEMGRRFELRGSE